MADTYGVTPDDVKAELGRLFPVGFTQATVPTIDDVKRWISTADDRVYLVAQDLVGAAPQVSDKAASLAKEFIISWTAAKVLRATYAGNDPAALANLLQPAFSVAKDALQALIDLGTQLEGTGAPSPRLAVSSTMADRCLVIDDQDLDGREPHRPFGGTGGASSGFDWGRF